jgi:hypothetical protein
MEDKPDIPGDRQTKDFYTTPYKKNLFENGKKTHP